MWELFIFHTHLQEIIPFCFVWFRARQTDELLEELEREQYVLVIDKGHVSFKSLFSHNYTFFFSFNSYFISAGIYLLKVNNRNTRIRCEICSKLTIKTPERSQWRQWRGSGVCIVNFEHISHLVLVLLLLTVNKYLPTGISVIFYNLI